MRTGMADRKTIEATIRAYAAAWAAGDRAAWLDTFAESATQEDPVGSRVRRGRAEIGEFWDTAMAAFDSIEIVPRNIFVVGDEAAMEWTINAVTARGGVTFGGVDVFTFDDAGRIASVRAYWERARLAEKAE
ncbi:MAG TPA: SgcJ/EcaC family oxidoreductase [Thermoanaerobaculia bacterium]|nr:SgcJ/EcaC family oxidoreductase [Thermoanaerobaculia bacterium]